MFGEVVVYLGDDVGVVERGEGNDAAHVPSHAQLHVWLVECGGKEGVWYFGCLCRHLVV